MTTRTTQILALLDAGHTPGSIATALSLPSWTIYGVLRKERPQRSRSPRRRTSTVPATVAALYKEGVAVPRIAELCGVSAAYVYRILQNLHGARK